MSVINQNHIECIHIQVSNITRNFSSSFFAEEVSAKIYKLIRKMTSVRQLSQLTSSQYNVIMHHLRRLENAAYLHYCAVSSLERSLPKQMLKCNMIINTDSYRRNEFSREWLDMAQKKAKSVINFDRLFDI